MTGWNPIVDRTTAAQDRILSVAGELFCRNGSTTVSMADIAAAVGCSRATLYRYYENRTQLQLAYIAKAAVAIADTVQTKTAQITDPTERLTEAVLISLSEVRANPALAAWFAPNDAKHASELAVSSETIELMAAGYLATTGPARPGAETLGRARWTVRVILSLLTIPGPSAESERDMVRRFLAPVVID